MKTLLQKRVLIPVALFVLLASVVAIARSGRVEVTTAIAAMDTLTVTIPVEGRTRARDLYTVTAPISGRVTRLVVREGQSVAAGQELGRIYAAPQDPRTVAAVRAEVTAATAGLRNAEVAVQEARGQAEQTEREIERRRPLAEMGAISAEAMEQAELAGRVARQRLEAAESGLGAAEATLEGARARLRGLATTSTDAEGIAIVAPVAGRVLRVPDESERVLMAGAPLLELANTGGLEVVFDVLSEDAVRIEPGHQVRIDSWGGEGTLLGEIRSLTLAGYTKISALGVEEQRVDVIGDLRDIPPTLGTGYRVQGDVVVWHGSGLVVPTSAMFREGNVWRLFVVENGRAARRDVEIGHRNEAFVEVTAGLSEGEEVVLFPSEEIDDGVAVRTGN